MEKLEERIFISKICLFRAYDVILRIHKYTGKFENVEIFYTWFHNDPKYWDTSAKKRIQSNLS